MSTIYFPMLCLKIAAWVANSVDPDEMSHSAVSHLGLHCLHRSACPNTYGKYGKYLDRQAWVSNVDRDKTQAYSWARPAILVAGKGREVMLLFLLFLHFHSCSSFFPVPFFHLFCYLFCLFSLSLGDDTKWPTRVDVSLNPNSIKTRM